MRIMPTSGRHDAALNRLVALHDVLQA